MVIKRLLFFFLFPLAVSLHAQSAADFRTTLEKLKLPGITITEVQDVPAGSFTINGRVFADLPAFCRVALTSKPCPESNIRIEVWMPVTNWNARFLGTGNGGGAGSINHGVLAAGISRGFATANTDMGTSVGVMNAVGHPEIWKDFGYRATHEMTVAAKAVICAYYKKKITYSYFSGCSTGGQQSLMEAQRYPDDYDGILAGAPANNRTHLHASFIWNLQANNDGGHEIVSKKKMELLSEIVIKNFKAQDCGAPEDRFLSDPRICTFNPAMLPHCQDTVSDSCFSEAEINALKKIYRGPVNPRTGERIYSPLPMGGNKLENVAPHLYPFFWAFGKDFDYMKFDFDRDMAKADSMLAPILNANNPDLSRLKKSGGKIILYTGTDDQLVLPQDAINYYDRVIEELHGLKETQDFFRLFLVPGMGHCGGGRGLNDFGQGIPRKGAADAERDLLTTLINWVEKGIVPERLVATTFYCCDKADSIRFQRPLFPYPLLPGYTGGDPNLPSSYQPVARPAGGVLKPAEVYLR